MSELKEIGLPEVVRVHDPDGGSHVEPACDPAWDELTKLAWYAALVAVETGLPIRLFHHPDGYYNVNVPGHSVGGAGYRGTQDILVGIGMGADAARRHDAAQPVGFIVGRDTDTHLDIVLHGLFSTEAGAQGEAERRGEGWAVYAAYPVGERSHG